ncbi:MAG: HEPN domain-containing protein [Oligoflexia bacterium]|nr:HEPN domain-containing protein [Oligoflexia bacterium]
MMMTPKQERIYKPEYAIELIRIAEGDLGSATVLYRAEMKAAEAQTQAQKTGEDNENSKDFDEDIISGRLENICYLSQQCIEKAIKAVLCHLGIPIPLSHDLDLLISKIPQEHNFPINSSLSELTLFASIRRYEEGVLVLNGEDLTASIDIAKQVLSWSKSILK